ncbi:MAG: translation initiation factor IF-2 [Acidobacteriota bacterium]|nr:translation initiation factor IF-2 [Blastocatellia bacterium]MDW8413563.1 translation initiation factor IF-2 [Acidobacteriota bacterium]
MSKVRIYDLAKELKLDNKKVIEEVRRFGYDVSVPSNSIPLEVAEKVKSKYFPQKSQVERKVKLVKHRETAVSSPVEALQVDLVKTAAEPSKPPQSQLPAPAATSIVPARPTPQIRIVKKITPVVSAQAPAQVATTLPTAAAASAETPQSVEAPRTVSVQAQPEPTSVSAPVVASPNLPEDKKVEVPKVETSKPRIVRIEVPTAGAAATLKNLEHKEVETASVATQSSSYVEPEKPQRQPEPLAAKAELPVAKPEQSKPRFARTQIVPLNTKAQTSVGKGSLVAAPPSAQARNQMQQRGRQPIPAVPTPTQQRLQKPQHTGQQQSLRPGPGPRTVQPKSSLPQPAEQPVDLRAYVPPPDNRKKGRKTVQELSIKAVIKKEDKEKLPIRQETPTSIPTPRPIPTELKPIKLVEGCTVKEFAEKIDVKPKEVVALLLNKGVMATINQTLNADVAREIGRDFGYDVSFATFEEMTAEVEFETEPQAFEDTETRAPVVTVMGHVDHGKTSLLDAIRKTKVAEGEAGGITQHIGAYSVEVPDPDNPERKRRIVFLDTPGHEAFTRMRARGARVTDVVVLVVAADDGVMPQTVEAIEHAKAAGVPIVVAINKIDKPQAQPERVKKALSDYGLVWDGWGGDTVMVEVSAKQRINLTGLLEMILLTADILDLKASPKRLGSGVVLEAKLDKGRGPVATVLVQNGTLRVGDPVIAGLYFGRVRAMFDDCGKQVQEAGPSTPVEVLGLQGVPEAGDQFQVVTDVAKAQQISLSRQLKKRQLELSRSSAGRLEDIFKAMKAGKLKELLVILKADVQGSVEVLKDTLQKLSTDKVKVKVIRSGVGAITESDVLLARASNDMAHSAVIIGFNVRPEQRAEELAKQENVDIRLHTIIYKVEEEIRNAMLGLLDATFKEVSLGKAEIRRVIKVPKVGNIAGCFVTSGVIKRTANIRLVRDGVVVYEGVIASLKRFKEDVSEVKEGFECGIGIDKYSDIKEGDLIEAFTKEKVVPTEL